mgnify:CR=1 FL=1
MKGKLNKMNLIILLRGFTETEIADILYKYFEYLNERSFIVDIFRTIGFWILKGLYYITSLAYEFFDSIAGLNYFFKFDAINRIYSKIALVTGSIIVLYIVITSIKSILSMKLNKDIIKNAIISAVLIASLPFAMTKASELTVAGLNFIKSFNSSDITNLHESWKLGGYQENSQKSKETIVDNVFKNMFIDIKENLIDKDFKDIKKIEGNSLHIDDLKRIKINSMLLKDRVPIHKVLEYRLVGYDKEIEKITENGSLVPSFRVEGYYRWKFNFMYGVLFMILLLIVFLKSGITISKLIYELGYNKIVAPLILSTDVETGEKRKVIIREIGICYMTIVVTYISIQIYSQFLIFVNSVDFSLNSVQKIFIVAGATLGVFKGSSLIEKAFGIQSNHSSTSLSSWLYTLSHLKNLTTSHSQNKSNQNNNTENSNERNNNTGTSNDNTNEQFTNKLDQNKSNSNQDLNNYRNGTNEKNNNSNNSDISDINSYRPNGTNTEDINNYRNSDAGRENFSEDSSVWEKIKENRSEEEKNDYYKEKDIDNKNDFWDKLNKKD